MSHFRFGGNWKRIGPSRRDVRSGSMAFRKTPVACSAFFSRRICVVRMLAFTAKTNPARVAPTHASNVDAAGQSARAAIATLVDPHRDVRVGGIAVHPGDLIHADANRVATIPA